MLCGPRQGSSNCTAGAQRPGSQSWPALRTRTFHSWPAETGHSYPHSSRTLSRTTTHVPPSSNAERQVKRQAHTDGHQAPPAVHTRAQTPVTCPVGACMHGNSARPHQLARPHDCVRGSLSLVLAGSRYCCCREQRPAQLRMAVECMLSTCNPHAHSLVVGGRVRLLSAHTCTYTAQHAVLEGAQTSTRMVDTHQPQTLLLLLLLLPRPYTSGTSYTPTHPCAARPATPRIATRSHHTQSDKPAAQCHLHKHSTTCRPVQWHATFTQGPGQPTATVAYVLFSAPSMSSRR